MPVNQSCKSNTRSTYFDLILSIAVMVFFSKLTNISCPLILGPYECLPDPVHSICGQEVDLPGPDCNWQVKPEELITPNKLILAVG